MCNTIELLTSNRADILSWNGVVFHDSADVFGPARDMSSSPCAEDRAANR
jgi:hypothetical protein